MLYFLVAALVGCSSKPATQPEPTTTPSVARTLSLSPTPSDAPTPEVTHYRMLTVTAGQADVTFVVALNGATLGTLNGDTNGDVTPSVRPGDNSVVVSWSQAHRLLVTQKATLTIERKIPGQSDWTTVYSRVVDSRTKVREAKGRFTHEALGDNSASGGSLEDFDSAAPTDAGALTEPDGPIGVAPTPTPIR